MLGTLNLAMCYRKNTADIAVVLTFDSPKPLRKSEWDIWH